MRHECAISNPSKCTHPGRFMSIMQHESHNFILKLFYSITPPQSTKYSIIIHIH